MKLPWIRKQVPVLPALAGYQRWAATYSAESNPVKDYSNQLIGKMIPPLKGKAVLDAGCGTGFFCRLAESNGASSILAVDFSSAMIDEAKKICRITQFQCADIAEVKLQPGTFDCIVCALVLGHIEDLDSVLDNILPALRQGGYIVITDFHPFLTLHQSRRTFREERSGKTFEIRHYLHLFHCYVAAFRKHGVVLEELEEPEWNGVPVVFGMKARKC